MRIVAHLVRLQQLDDARGQLLRAERRVHPEHPHGAVVKAPPVVGEPEEEQVLAVLRAVRADALKDARAPQDGVAANVDQALFPGRYPPVEPGVLGVHGLDWIIPEPL